MSAMSRPVVAVLALAALAGCGGDPGAIPVPSADGQYIRVITVPGTERRVLEAHVVRNGKTRYVAAELGAAQLSQASFPLARNAVVEMGGSCGPVLWSPPANTLNAREWMAVRGGGMDTCPIPRHASSWTVLSARH